MDKYKVTFQLMVEPTKGDQTFNKSYTVEAVDDNDAIKKAEILKDADEPNISKRSVFNYFTKKIG